MRDCWSIGEKIAQRGSPTNCQVGEFGNSDKRPWRPMRIEEWLLEIVVNVKFLDWK